MKIKSYKKYEAGTGEITKEYAEKTFNELLAFQGYGFCKAHATSYSVYSAVQMWLQDHYFLEYMCALLSHIDRAKEKKDTLVLNERVEYCIKHGTWIYYPDVNESGYKWQIKAGGLLAPLKNIKGFTDKDVNTIIDNRPYNSLKEFLEKTKFNNKKFETLLFANAFNKWGNIEDQYNWYYNEYFEKDKKKKPKKIESFDLFAVDESQEVSSSEPETLTHFTKSELEDKSLDLNGFVVHENVMMKYHEVYSKHIYDYIKSYNENTAIGRSRIHKISDINDLGERTEKSGTFWVLGKIQNIARNLPGKKGTFTKVTVTDGESKLELFFWSGKHVPSFIKRGSVILVPLRIITDEETKKNRVFFDDFITDTHEFEKED